MDIQFQVENKKKAAAYVVLIGVGILFILHGIFKVSPAPTAKQQQPVKQTTATAVSSAPTHPGDIRIAASDDIVFKQNPFVDMANQKNNQLPGTPSAAAAGNANMSLPAIPGGMPRPSVPSMPLPAIPGNSVSPNLPVAPSTPMRESTVQGILTGNDGNNMAIMGDGKVVTEGDTYNDNRITYIGGDGITFEDGHQIGYK